MIHNKTSAAKSILKFRYLNNETQIIKEIEQYF